MKTLIGYRYRATRGGYISDSKIITSAKEKAEVVLKSEIDTKLEVGETGKPIRAIPKPDCWFTGWSDGVKSNPRTDTGNKNDYPVKYITANFEMKYTLWERIRAWIWGRRVPFLTRR